MITNSIKKIFLITLSAFAIISFIILAPNYSLAQTMENPFGNINNTLENTQLEGGDIGNFDPGQTTLGGNYIPGTGYTPPGGNSGSFGGSSGTCSTVYVSGTGIGGILSLIGCLFRSIIPLLVTAAVIVFIYGVVNYIRNADSADQRKEGGMFMLYGVIALFVMVSIWALVGILGATLGVDAVLPQLPE